MSDAIDDREILDDTIRELKTRMDATKDSALWLKLNTCLLKALSLKAKSSGKSGKARGFQLGRTQ